MELYYLKGAPEKVLCQCKYWGSKIGENEFLESDYKRVMERSRGMGSSGLRGIVQFGSIVDIIYYYTI